MTTLPELPNRCPFDGALLEINQRITDRVTAIADARARELWAYVPIHRAVVDELLELAMRLRVEADNRHFLNGGE